LHRFDLLKKKSNVEFEFFFAPGVANSTIEKFPWKGKSPVFTHHSSLRREASRLYCIIHHSSFIIHQRFGILPPLMEAGS
jgi:hypothetical protein